MRYALIDFLLNLDWTQIIIALMTAGGGALILWYRKTLKRWKEFWRAVSEGLANLPKLQKDVAGIHYFVSPNGGGSLMDSTRRIEVNVSALGDQLNMLSETMRAENDTDEDLARFYCDANGANTYVNQTYARWLGVGKAELLGWGFMNIIHPDDVARVHAHWEQCRRENRQYRATYRMVASDGEFFTVSVTATPIPENSPALRWVGSAKKVKTDDHN